MLPVGGRKIELAVDIPLPYCKDCGSVRQPHLTFDEPKKHYTRSLERFVVDLCRIMTIQDAAELTGLGWDTVKEIHKRHLRGKNKSFNLKKIRHIIIDEVYLGKKRKYITIVLDLRTGRVIRIAKGKGKDALKGLWKRLRQSKAKIQAVVIAMASGYMAEVLEHLPKAGLVLDHFHLAKWSNEKLSLLRRQLYRQATEMHRAVLKGSRWLLLKAPENLKPHEDPGKDERIRLQAALELNQPLANAYYMKERLRLLFQCTSRDRAVTELKAWIQQATRNGIKILKDAARKLSAWKSFIFIPMFLFLRQGMITSRMC